MALANCPFMHRSIILLAVVTTFSLTAACSTAPSLLPNEQMAQMGDNAWEKINRQQEELDNPDVENFVQQVTRRVVEASNMKGENVEVKVFKSDEKNAFALPGGHIGVYSGILPVAKNGAGLAAILAHEIAHITQEHSNERVSQKLLTSAALTGASAALGSVENHDLVMGALGVGAQLGVILPYTREQERESDRIGLETLARAGYNPQAAVELWQRMQQASDGSGAPTFLRTHPKIEDRIAYMKDVMPEMMDIYRSASQQYGLGESVPDYQWTPAE